MSISAACWDETGNQCEITVSGGYNPDILDDIQARVIRMHREMLHNVLSAAEGLETEVEDDEEGQDQDA